MKQLKQQEFRLKRKNQRDAVRGSFSNAKTARKPKQTPITTSTERYRLVNSCIGRLLEGAMCCVWVDEF